MDRYIHRHEADYLNYEQMSVDRIITSTQQYQDLDRTAPEGKLLAETLVRQNHLAHQTQCAFSGIPDGRYGSYKKDLATAYALDSQTDN